MTRRALCPWPAPERVCAAFCLAFGLAACGGGGGSGSDAAPPPAALSQAAALGKKIFFDISLSASGKMACATCHDPAFAHAQPNSLAVQSGGAGLDVPGLRAVPSLDYLSSTPAFFIDGEGTPTGGFDRDGRVDTLADQAIRPFLAAHEMANASATEVANRLVHAAYADEFRQVFGNDVFADADTAFLRARQALERYQREDLSFRAFDSKYDAFLAGKATLTPQEMRGLALFNAPDKGNCAGCHPSGRGADGSPPLFTDFTYDNLGLPRNAAIPGNADPAYRDMGLCGPFRTDLAARRDFCGAFKVPTLRNVATRKVMFHNAAFTSLKDALTFYVQRDTNPEKFYPPAAGGGVDKFDDLPADLARNVNTTEVPYNRHEGEAPALSDAEIDDVIAFLATLNDGYTP
ncbi:MAG TPA: cytochrome c peroxidase [Casimicrobiaceae bacterium]|nr:cytochrome c peroxidase [Casimicrobiaceae bacterium]